MRHSPQMPLGHCIRHGEHHAHGPSGIGAQVGIEECRLRKIVAQRHVLRFRFDGSQLLHVRNRLKHSVADLETCINCLIRHDIHCRFRVQSFGRSQAARHRSAPDSQRRLPQRGDEQAGVTVVRKVEIIDLRLRTVVKRREYGKIRVDVLLARPCRRRVAAEVQAETPLILQQAVERRIVKRGKETRVGRLAVFAEDAQRPFFRPSGHKVVAEALPLHGQRFVGLRARDGHPLGIEHAVAHESEKRRNAVAVFFLVRVDELADFVVQRQAFCMKPPSPAVHRVEHAHVTLARTDVNRRRIF